MLEHHSASVLHTCYAEPCISYHRVVRPSITHSHCVKTTQDSITKFSLADSARTLVLGIKRSSRNLKRFIPSKSVIWEWGRKNLQFSANKSPYLRNGAR